jgi:plastocyanin
MKRIFAAAAVAGAMLLNVGVMSAQTPVETNEVPMAQNKFVYPDVAVPAGTTVTWTNLDPETHDVVDMANGGFGTVFESGPVAPGMTYSFTFDVPGLYPYTCTYHADQVGVIFVY